MVSINQYLLVIRLELIIIHKQIMQLIKFFDALFLTTPATTLYCNDKLRDDVLSIFELGDMVAF